MWIPIVLAGWVGSGWLGLLHVVVRDKRLRLTHAPPVGLWDIGLFTLVGPLVWVAWWVGRREDKRRRKMLRRKAMLDAMDPETRRRYLQGEAVAGLMRGDGH